MTFSRNKKHLNIKTFKVTNKIDDSFVGLKINNDSISVFYPETYQMSDIKENYSGFCCDVLSLLKTISLSKSLSNPLNVIKSNISKDGSISLNSCIWLINDFIENGYYINRESKFKRNVKGKIDWKRTLDTEPIISGRNLIYNDLVVKVKDYEEDDIAIIYKYCVKFSLDFLGWLYGIPNGNFIDDSKFMISKQSQYVQILRATLNETFDDIKKIRLTHMLRILRGADNKKQENEIIYGVDSYHYIYEKMLGKLLGNLNPSDFFPSSNWHLIVPDKKDIPGSKLRPDSLALFNDVLYILDAKYYRFGFTGNGINDLPDTSSIQKQVTYGEFAKLNLPDKCKYSEIRNAFILPYNKMNNIFNFKNDIEYIGYADTDYKENKEGHEKVYAFLIDLKYLINHYNSYDSNMVKTLAEQIIKERNKLQN